MSFELILPFFRPIQALLLDDDVSEIMGNPDGAWSFERNGRLMPAEGVRFDFRSLQTGLEVIANHLGKQLDNEHPLLNAQLPDGSRLAAVLPQLFARVLLSQSANFGRNGTRFGSSSKAVLLPTKWLHFFAPKCRTARRC